MGTKNNNHRKGFWFSDKALKDAHSEKYMYDKSLSEFKSFIENEYKNLRLFYQYSANTDVFNISFFCIHCNKNIMRNISAEVFVFANDRKTEILNAEFGKFLEAHINCQDKVTYIKVETIQDRKSVNIPLVRNFVS